MIGPLAAVLIVAEIVAFVAVAHATSWGLAILLLLATSIVGGAIARRTAVGAFRRMVEARRGGRPPDGAVADSAVAFAGSVLLFLPGFVTDAIGLLMVLPPTRRLARVVVGRRLAARMLRRRGARGRTFRTGPRRPPTGDSHDVIEGTLEEGPENTTPR